MKLNFTISELIHSDIAVKYNINNMPDINSLDNLLNLIFYCLQPIRDKIGKPIIINSGYRNLKLNRIVGGTSTSQHTRGQAVDFTIKGMSVSSAVDFVRKSGVEYDQIINEHNRWVHLSFNKKNNRKQCFEIK